eukprot:CAMPEP_0173422228 /NCGR_PEP_ID=MMETSP1357-20121228/3018_1 /TAXON_ID=77926 /ORGANISM="Hemiselmis rufescens, Strain PCC563" /LENGTH=174 /DNA_ID=CAMNT_0014385229 /DNA_START=53 /DNA_END=577 /DNA_ORIENTATION=+
MAQGGGTTTYDITDTMCQCIHVATCPLTFMAVIPGIMGTKTMHLEPEELRYTVECLGCCNQDRRIPYGEMGEVHKVDCCCCKGVGVGRGITSCPGSGCDEAYVDKVLEDLKARQRTRGDQAQIQKTEQIKAEMDTLTRSLGQLHGKVDLLLKQQGIRAPVELEPPATVASMAMH